MPRPERFHPTIVVALCLCTLLIVTTALNNGLARTPPMGWLDWEQFRCNTDCTKDPDNCISENLFLKQAECMVALGLKDAGYVQVNIDDCWSEKERDATGKLQADHERFPHGIKYLADKIHGMGLKLGIYADFGTRTCAGYPGSLDHLQIDAETFANWTIDMLKMDGCNVNVSLMNDGYPEMTMALNKTGRPIVFSCSWPDYERASGRTPDYKLVAENCNLWRNFNDISDSWDSVVGIIKYYGDSQDAFQPYAGPGNWNDPDMVIVGDKGLNLDQAKAQFAIWSMFAAPLLISVDLRLIQPEYLDILLNEEIIAVDQDKLGIMGRRVLEIGEQQFFSRPLSNSSYAVAYLNLDNGGGPSKLCANLTQLNIKAEKVFVRDLYLHKDLGVFSKEICMMVNPTGVVIVKVTPQG